MLTDGGIHVGVQERDGGKKKKSELIYDRNSIGSFVHGNSSFPFPHSNRASISLQTPLAYDNDLQLTAIVVSTAIYLPSRGCPRCSVPQNEPFFRVWGKYGFLSAIYPAELYFVFRLKRKKRKNPMK
jgi:hypothetical protein